MLVRARQRLSGMIDFFSPLSSWVAGLFCLSNGQRLYFLLTAQKTLVCL